jgi:hypothetical protein
MNMWARDAGLTISVFIIQQIKPAWITTQRFEKKLWPCYYNVLVSKSAFPFFEHLRARGKGRLICIFGSCSKIAELLLPSFEKLILRWNLNSFVSSLSKW